MKRRPNNLLEKPIFQVMPPLSTEEYEALKADIGEHGVQVPVEMDESGAILDGHHRVKACQELGINKWPTVVRIGLSTEEKRAHASRLNLARRHFTQEQKRLLIKEQLKETPEKSNNGIARLLGVSDKTVQTVRKDLEGTSEIPKLERLVGADGKERPCQVQPTWSLNAWISSWFS